MKKPLMRSEINNITSMSCTSESAISEDISLIQTLPFILMHFSLLAIFWVGFSWIALVFGLLTYVIRMFAITAFYHRYFSHKNFKTSRTTQFVFAFIAASAGQKGPLWWASHHRVHHTHTDTPDDPHSPKYTGFINSHLLWFLRKKNGLIISEKIKDFSSYPELRWIDKYEFIPPITLAAITLIVGLAIEKYFPAWEVTASQIVVWGFFVSTIILYHATYTINSLAHKFGTRRFQTTDESRNNIFLALLTLGEGWHNNHHFYSGCARQGFAWWELDISYYLLKIMSYFGLVWDLKPIPVRIKKML